MSHPEFMRPLAIGLLCLIGASPIAGAEERIFSGPQKGDPLPALPVQLVLSESPNRTVDAARREASSPPHRLVLFVHQLTRPSVGFARVLGEYAATRAEEGLDTSLIFLGDDATAVAESVRRARNALPQTVTVGISPDGAEGPGAYGLNRNVTLTILLASEGVVTANHVLVDPSIPVDLPKVMQSICDLLGGIPPSVESLTAAAPGRPGVSGPSRMQDAAAAEPVPKGFLAVEPLLRRLIQKTTSDADVDRLAAEINKKLEDSPEAREHLRRIAERVYKTYGTPRAQHHLRGWAGVTEPTSSPADGSKN